MPFFLRPFHRSPTPFLTLPLAYVLGFWALITLLVLNNGPAYAEWVAIGYSESLGGYTVYVVLGQYGKR
jgi:membrane associated rhomboid family serine protease